MSGAATIEAGVRREAEAVLRIAVPVAISSLSQLAMGLTDTILLGGIGGDALAAGGLGASLFFTTGVILQGVLVAAGVLIAQARGAGEEGRIGGLYGTALAIGLVLSLPAFAFFSEAERVLLWLGEPAGLAHDVGRYLGILRWGTPAFLAGLGVLRAVLPAIDQADLLLRVTPVMAVANGVLNYGLIHGVGRMPGLGLEGSALATMLTLWMSVLVLFGMLHGSTGRRGMVRRLQLDRGSLGPLLRIGAPVSVTIAAETLLFMVASIAAGRLGTAALAAHSLVLSIASFVFMVPLSLGQAANVLTGMATGAGDARRVRRVGLVAIGLAVAIMAGIGLGLLLTPRLVVGLFLDPAVAGNRQAVGIAVALLGIAALFQVADGVQAVAIGALRGMGDSAVPMVLAAVGYWAVGAPLGWLLGFRLGMGAVGLWIGLAGALVSVAVMMTGRFVLTTRSGGAERA